MGIIIREYRCGDCGSAFESSDPVEEVTCPSCSSEEAEREFRTAPGFKSPKTSTADAAQKALASDFGLTNMSNKDGGPVKRGPQGPAPQFADTSSPVMQAVGRLGAQADAFSPMMGGIRGAGPRPDWAARDSKNKPVR